MNRYAVKVVKTIELVRFYDVDASSAKVAEDRAYARASKDSWDKNAETDSPISEEEVGIEVEIDENMGKI
jgi:hypothetical protein